jgi:hypothetical protein
MLLALLGPPLPLMPPLLKLRRSLPWTLALLVPLLRMLKLPKLLLPLKALAA